MSVALIVCALGIPCEEDDFHCHDYCDNPLSHVTPQPVKPKAASAMPASDLGCKEPMVIPVKISGPTVPKNLKIPDNLNPVKASAMIDNGASTQVIDPDFIMNLNLKFDLKPKLDTLIVFDGRESEDLLTHTCTLNLTIDQHLETLTFQVTRLAGWQMILGKTWLKKQNSAIDWLRNSVSFASGYCQAHCLPTRSPTNSAPSQTPGNPAAPGQYKIALVSRVVFRHAVKAPASELFMMAMSAIRGQPEQPDPAKHPNYHANLVPECYHDLLPLFMKKGADKLPPHWYVDHEIPLTTDKEGNSAKPPMG